MAMTQALQALFDETLSSITPQLKLLEPLTQDIVDFYGRSGPTGCAFEVNGQGRTWALALYPPHGDGAPKFRLRTASAVQLNALHLRRALASVGIESEITSKIVAPPPSAETAAGSVRPLWRVDLAPPVWPRITVERTGEADASFRRQRALAALDHVASAFWETLAQPHGTAPRWHDGKMTGFALTVPVRAECTAIERALDTARIPFRVWDLGDDRLIEVGDDVATGLVTDGAMVQRARAQMEFAAAQYLQLPGGQRSRPCEPATLEKDACVVTFEGRPPQAFSAAAH